MSVLRNLISGQYQIGDIVFGKGTTVRVETFDIKPYDVNNQDYQVSRSDEIRFGWDAHKPTTIEITFHVMKNWLLPPFEDLIPNFWKEMPTVADFQVEWKANEIRQIWGQMKALYYCPGDGITRVIYGRPGHFTYAKDTEYTETVQCLGEFRRADTLSYSANETAVELSSNAEPSYLTRTSGDADAWLRIVGFGPITNPIITIGTQEVALTLDLEEGEGFEVSSYPWQRRAVDSNRVNLNAAMLGTTYLDKLIIPANQKIPVRFTSNEVSTWMPALDNQSWTEDIPEMKYFQMPDTFDSIHGVTVVRFDLFNFDWYNLQFSPGFYLAPALFSAISAVLYNAKRFNTASQYAQAEIVEPRIGSAAIVIMSDDTMTNFACLEIHCGIFNNWLRIRSGTAYNETTVEAEWHNTNIPGWFTDGTIAIDYDPETKTYTGYWNGEARLHWIDEAEIVSTDNRRQGFIFNLNSDVLTQGPGFRNIVCYDTAAASPGQIFLAWRDAWSTIS